MGDEGLAPSNRRRIAAIVALVCAVLLVVCLLVMLLSNVAQLGAALIGIGIAGWGGWWTATERMPRRAFGIAGIVVGLVLVAWMFVEAASDNWLLALARLLLVIALLAGFSAATRVALVPDLHEMDRRRVSLHFRPERPVLICNPKSGGGKVEQFDLVDRAKGLGVEVVMLEPGLDLEQLARGAVARGADCLAMAGGDGSQALVASVAVEHGIPFVCISAGTRNHFALDLGLDRDDPSTGLAAFTTGVTREVDYATVGDRFFVNNVSLGIYAAIVQEDSYRDAKGETAANRIPELLGAQAEPFDLQFTTPDGTGVDGAFLLLVSNNPYVMGPSGDIGQRRSMETGQLGVFAVSSRTGLEAAKLLARSAVGLAGRDPNVHEFTTQEFEITSRSGTAFAGVDGEALDLPTPLRFRIHPRGLRLLVPGGTLEEAARREARGFDPADLWAVARGRPASLEL